MGIETIADVEESTEPPICAYTDPKPHSAATNAKYSSRVSTADAKARPLINEHPTLALRGKFETDRPAFHCVEPSTICELLQTDLQNGLSDSEAGLRLERDGPNTVLEVKGVSPLEIFLRQVSNSLTIVLLITMGLSFGIDDYIEGGVITAVILLNIVVGFIQDYRAEKTILSLHRLSAPVCKAIRGGRVASVKAQSLVVGDIVRLSVGDIVPADLRLFEGMNASTDEALLTGESLPVLKNPHQTFDLPDIPIGDRTNMAYSGCSTTQGRATGIVVATGMDTEVGKIAQLLRQQTQNASEPPLFRLLRRIQTSAKNILGLVGTPLQVKLSKFALLLFALAILLAIIVFSVNLWDVQGEVLIYGIAVAVAVIPESLVAVLTITIAVGTKAMARAMLSSASSNA
ncbi:hypothetical protein N7470_002242 [Penicillium chermesinum]|nr:hypothetical protein N7470_002242 [Penicillium chermesinum]